MTQLTTVAPPEGFGATMRRDIWWLRPTLILAAFATFLIYGTICAFQEPLYTMKDAKGNPVLGPYVTPFESPNLIELGLAPAGVNLGPLLLTPALLVLWAPGGFRFTCYFCRLAYHRSVLGDPPGCAVGEWKRTYRGEKGFFWINNFHRYFLYVILIFVVFHWIHFLLAFYYKGHGLGIGVGTLVTGFDTVALTMYVGGCHSLRHLVGGRQNHFNQDSLTFKLWNFVSKINAHHGLWFWLSLGSVMLADMYMRLLAHGVIKDFNTWSSF